MKPEPISTRFPNLSPLKQALLALEEMQARLDKAEGGRTAPVAIVGMGCRFPKAENPASFWRLLADGVDAVVDIPDTRWPAGEYYDPDPDAPSKMATRWAGLLDQVDRFDAEFFGISPREARSMDPQQRLLLEVAWEAIENAGYNPQTLASERTGVFVGMTGAEYETLFHRAGDLSEFNAYYASGVARSVAAGRISYILGFQGPNLCVDTACSSSLVAVHLACLSLRAGECRTALAGGVNAVLSPEMTMSFSKSHMLASDGRCKAFDARADGFVRGEGCGILVLKSLSDALRDGDRVMAVIRGSAINQDGRSGGLTIPNGGAQQAVIRAALANAHVDPLEISYVETHGTGTALGDPIEAHALAAALGEGRTSDNPLVIGAVKTNIGHLEAASGVAGLIKAALCLQHGKIPANLHFERMNPHIQLGSVPVEIPVREQLWPRRSRPRFAAVSSFGFSGTNANVVLEESPQEPLRRLTLERTMHAFALSARSQSALRALTGAYADYLESATEPLADICFTANAGRSHFDYRLLVSTNSLADLRGKLAGGVSGTKVTERDGVSPVFLFTGQGAQYAGMGRELYQTQPVFRAVMEECDRLLRPALEQPLLEALYGSAGNLLDQTAYTQPALFAIEYALAELWKSWGIRPTAVLGHSVGEYAALCVAGVVSLEEGLGLIAERGRLMQQLPGAGAMAAALAEEEVVREAMRGWQEQVSIAAVNAPQNVVISGERDAVEAMSGQLRQRGVGVQQLAVSHAFHSAQMDPMVEEFARRAAGMEYRAARVAVISSVTGQAVGREELQEAGYWRRQVRETVQFRRGMETLGEAGHRMYLEIGPGTTLLGLGRRCLDGREGEWLASLRRGQSDWRPMLESLGALYVRGAEVDWAGFDKPYERRRVSLPTYPFERQRYWLDARPVATSMHRPRNLQHPLLEIRTPAAIPIYEGRFTDDSCPSLAGHRVVGVAVVPAAAYIELALAVAAETAGVQAGAVYDLTLREPLRLTDQPHRAQIVLSLPSQSEAHFQIFARPDSEDAQAPWTLQATGRLGSSGDAPRSQSTSQAAEPAGQVSPAAFYEMLRARGFDPGPHGRVIRELWCGKGRAVAEVEIEPSLPAETAAYHAFPPLLDGCFQALGAALLFDDRSSSERTYVTSAVAGFRFFATLQGRLTVHAAVSPDGESGAFLGDLKVFDSAGNIVAESNGVSLRPIDSPPDTAPDDWFYTVEWQRAGQSEAASVASPQLFSAEVARSLDLEAAALSVRERYDRYALLRPRLDAIAALHIVDALRHLGFPLSVHDRVFEVDLARYGILESHRALLARMLEILREDGILQRDSGGWKVARTPDCECLPELWQAIEQDFPAFGAELDVTRRCTSELANVLQGKVSPLDLLFPGGSFAALEKLYIESPSARVMNELLGRAVRHFVDKLPADRPVRVLEIGAGTGGSTTYLAPQFASARTEYVFSDLSPFFLVRAREKFSAYPFLHYRLLDIENDPASQGFAESQFDIVIAANVLHATADLRRTVAHAKRLIAPGGMLAVVEGTRAERWVDLTFGMTGGWWKFTDTGLRPDHPLLSKRKWLELLSDLGFHDPAAVEPVPDAPQVLLFAGIPATPADAGRWLLVPDAHGVAASLAASIERSGGSVEMLASAACTSEILAADAYDYVVHLASLAPPGDKGTICWDIVALVQSLAKTGGKPARLWLATRGAQPLAADRSAVALEQAPVWGLARTVALEHPKFWGGAIDLDPEFSAAECAARVLDAILHPDGEDQIVFRSGDRYVPRLKRRPPPASQPVRFLPDGSYLITGGLGSLGLTVACWMVENGARKLVLIGRSASSDKSRRAIREIEALGATVRVAALDVADANQLSDLGRTFAPGDLRGIVHAAAVFDWSSLEAMTPGAFASVMHPKVAGTWALHEWSKSMNLDFFVMFSSTTTLLGSHNLAHYAAANQFLNAMAHYRRAQKLPALTVHWGVWDEMGDTSAEQRAEYLRAGLYPMRSSAALDALGRLLNSRDAEAMVAEIDWDALRPIYEARRRRPFLAGLSTAARRKTAPPEPVGKAELAAEIAGSPPSEHREIAIASVRALAAAVLGVKPDEVDVNRGLFEMGMDSLMSVELKGRLQKAAGISLPSTLTFNYPSVCALSSYLLDRLASPQLPAKEESREPGPPPAADERSEDELAMLLAAAIETLQ